MSVQMLDIALNALDRALAARPHMDGYAFTEATTAVCAYRDTLRTALRSTPDDPAARHRLKAANVAVTLLLAGHFPLDSIPWPQIETLRDHLQAMKPDVAA